MKLLNKILGDPNEKYLKKTEQIVSKINSLEKEFEGFSVAQLKDKTKEFKQKLEQGSALDDLLPEAFALVRESAKRTLGPKALRCPTDWRHRPSSRKDC